MIDDIELALKNWFSNVDRTIIAGIGNPIRGDDYAGLKIAECLQGKVSNNVCVIECETVPESYLLDIENFHPTHVLLVDAAVLGIPPGKTRLVDVSAIAWFSAFSSHVLPLRVFCEYIIKMTGAKVALLLIEPKNMEFGGPLSPEVKTAVDKLTGILMDLLS
ncbi:MAG: hydrogenase 3 maturation endopeptidase HyCI [Nitrososphaerota archaeon]|jgi:hydrogenase 3 maturation protease|nr:hydrogenase 3 maturation endopeptidase HyCI [Nitrososphaerota archaeon]